MVKKKYASKSHEDMAKYRRTVLAYLHNLGIEGGCSDLVPKGDKSYGVTIDYQYPTDWNRSTIKSIESGLEAAIKKALDT